MKEHKTADCVVVGVRWKSKPEKLATLLLGLYREDGEVDYVGSAAVGARNHDAIAARVLPLLDERSERRFSSPTAGVTRGWRRRRSATSSSPRCATTRAGEPLPPRHEADPLPRRQGSGSVHVA